jgi:hypothetical protein
MNQLASGCRNNGYTFIVIGDESSPDEFNLEGCEFFSIKNQISTGLKFAEMCPTRHYARKNIGYLIAIKNGAQVIIETDDDNLPYDTFWRKPERKKVEKIVEDTGWINIYRYFSDAYIWPRGLPLEKINNEMAAFESLSTRQMDCPIQQGLADENPDVDSIYRLIMPLPQYFRKDRRVVLAKNTWCPLNSQNTTWWPDAFPLLYLPSYCSFRMTDIWRGFIAQQIAHINGWGILFHEPTVRQERNQHNLLKDFRDEISGYLNNYEICSEFERLDLIPGADKIGDNLQLCYQKLIDKDLVHVKEMKLLDAWISDINNLLDN